MSQAKEDTQDPASLPTSPEMLMETLRTLDIDFTLYHHEAVFTVAESEKLDKNIPALGCRNLFVRDKKKRMFLITLSNDTEVDLKDLEKKLECGRLSFGSAGRLWEHLGVRPGSVCPFAAINDSDHNVQIILDTDMMNANLVCYHPLLNTMSISLRPADLLKFFAHTGHSPKIMDLKIAQD